MSLDVKPAEHPNISPRKSSMQLSQAWDPSPRPAHKTLADDTTHRDAPFDSDNEGRSAAKARLPPSRSPSTRSASIFVIVFWPPKRAAIGSSVASLEPSTTLWSSKWERQEDADPHSVMDDDRDVEELEEVFVDDADDAEDAQDSSALLMDETGQALPADVSSMSRSQSMSRAASNSSTFSADAAAVAAAITGSSASQPDSNRDGDAKAADAANEQQAHSPSGSLFTSPSLGGLREAAALRSAREYKLPAPPPVNLAGATATAPRTVSTPSSQPTKPSNLNPLGRAQSLSRPGARAASLSRSTSRSHSPMPGVMMTSSVSASSGSPRLSPSRRTRALPAEESGPRPWMQPLEELWRWRWMCSTSRSTHSLYALAHALSSSPVSNQLVDCGTSIQSGQVVAGSSRFCLPCWSQSCRRMVGGRERLLELQRRRRARCRADPLQSWRSAG